MEPEAVARVIYERTGIDPDSEVVPTPWTELSPEVQGQYLAAADGVIAELSQDEEQPNAMEVDAILGSDGSSAVRIAFGSTVAFVEPGRAVSLGMLCLWEANRADAAADAAAEAIATSGLPADRAVAMVGKLLGFPEILKMGDPPPAPAPAEEADDEGEDDEAADAR